MITPPVEELLREYLESQRRAELSGHSNAILHKKVDECLQAVRDVGTEQLAQRNRMNRYGRRLRELETRGSRPHIEPDDPDDTGQHQIEDYRLAQAEAKLVEFDRARRESMIWWKRKRWDWILAIVAAVVATAVTGCVTYVLTRTPTTPAHVENSK